MGSSNGAPPPGTTSGPASLPPANPLGGSPPGPAGGNGPHRRKVAVGAATAAVLVVLLLLISGVFPGLFGPSSVPGIPYSTAEPRALEALPAGFSANPIVLAGVGIDSRTATTLNLSTLANATTNCSVTQLSGYPASGLLPVPSFSGGFDSGRAPLWVVAFAAASGGPYALVAVDEGATAPLVTAAGTGCGSLLSGVRALPSTFADSPAAAGSAWANGGSSFVGHSSNASALTMIATGGQTSGLFTSPLWVFVYGACTPLAGGTVGHAGYLVTVSLVSAAFQLATTWTVNCPT